MFQRFFDEGLAQAPISSPAIARARRSSIDPRRDVDVYVAAAAAARRYDRRGDRNARPRGFRLGRARAAARPARATIAGPGAGLGFRHHEVRDGERLRRRRPAPRRSCTRPVTRLSTSPSSRARAGEPARVFTGDTLFVGAVGRPDLLGDAQTRQLAGELYDSLSQTLLALDDAVEVHPGHGAGSLCGAGIGAEPSVDDRAERRVNPMLQHGSREAFVAAVLADLPETPPYFAGMKRVNREGPSAARPCGGLRRLPALDAGTGGRAPCAEGASLIDLARRRRVLPEHPAGALNIALRPEGRLLGRLGRAPRPRASCCSRRSRRRVRSRACSSCASGSTRRRLRRRRLRGMARAPACRRRRSSGWRRRVSRARSRDGG